MHLLTSGNGMWQHNEGWTAINSIQQDTKRKSERSPEVLQMTYLQESPTQQTALTEGDGQGRDLVAGQSEQVLARRHAGRVQHPRRVLGQAVVVAPVEHELVEVLSRNHRRHGARP